RVVRRLGAGERAVVFLGRSLGDDDADSCAALKVFGADVDNDSIATEVAALSAARSPHVERLIDVAAGTGEPRCLVLERLSGGSLAALLRERTSVRAGEAVTILASIARGLEDLHEAGFAHGRLTLATVMFAETGRPVLIGLGYAVTAGEASIAADYGRLEIVAGAVLSRVEREGRDEAVEAVGEWLAAVQAGHIRSREPGELEELIFRIAQAVPVRLRTRSRVSPDRLVPAPPRGSQATTLFDVAHAAIDGHPLRLVLGTLAARMRPRRRLLWFAGGLSAGLVVLALMGLPSGRADSLDTGSARGSPAPQGSTSRSTAGSPGSMAGSPPSSPRAAATAPAISQPSAARGSPDQPASDRDPILADDPVAATGALFVERARCLAAGSLACLEGADQLGSAALDADQSAVARARGGATAHAGPDYARYQASLIERTGDSALIELAPPVGESGARAAPENSKPASVLVIKGEAGWRLREIFEY
ncbi:MAG: eukaryotic-like serine/threonine-protein kinase, partial [Microbacteriaceae bacterium]|nr:eukaryotic-like serine/threonine-protein kinase [Microbacteriaceae bacterium]